MITEKDYLEAKKIVQEYEIKYLNISVVRKSSPLIEGKTKSNVKKNKQIGRLAPPPPPMKRWCLSNARIEAVLMAFIQRYQQNK